MWQALLNEWTPFLTHTDTVVFTGSIGLMIAFFLVETLLTLVVGGGIGHLVDHAFAAHPHVHVPGAQVHAPHGTTGVPQNGGVLQWLQLGQVPFMVWFTVFLTSFGLIGLGGQAFAHDIIGHYLPLWWAVPTAFVASLPIVRTFSKMVSRWVPQEQTWAVDEEDFMGREAVIILGIATFDQPAQAKLSDIHGRTHYVMVSPSDASVYLASGTHVRLGRRIRAGRFTAEPLLGVLPTALPPIDAFVQNQVLAAGTFNKDPQSVVRPGEQR